MAKCWERMRLNWDIGWWWGADHDTYGSSPLSHLIIASVPRGGKDARERATCDLMDALA